MYTCYTCLTTVTYYIPCKRKYYNLNSCRFLLNFSTFLLSPFFSIFFLIVNVLLPFLRHVLFSKIKVSLLPFYLQLPFFLLSVSLYIFRSLSLSVSLCLSVSLPFLFVLFQYIFFSSSISVLHFTQLLLISDN